MSDVLMQKRTDFNILLMCVKEGNPCDDCHKFFPSYVMQFDHVRGRKLHNISDMGRYSLDSLEAELSKCDIVCSNCHAVRTYFRRNQQKVPGKKHVRRRQRS